MAQNDSHRSFPEIGDFAVDTPPVDLLKVVGDEMRKPIIAIEGIAIVLLEMELQQHHRDLLERVPGMTAYLKAILDRVDTYVEERRKLRRQEHDEE